MYKTHSQQLTDYIRKNVKKGYTIDSLRFSLISQGYSKISVENSIELANKQIATEIPEINEKTEITIKNYEETKNLNSNQKINSNLEINEENNSEIETNEVPHETIKKKSFWSKLFG